MSRYFVMVMVLFSYTGISVGKIGKALLTPFHLVMGGLIGYAIFFGKKKNQNVLVTLVVLLVYILFVNVLAYPNVRPTSILYSIIYVLEMLIVYNFMKTCSVETMLFAFRIILYSYAANLFLGNVFDAVGFHNSFIGEYIRVHHATGDSAGRPMGFSSEPSYASFILSVVFLCYSHLRKHDFSKEILKMAGVYMLCILLTKSAYGFIFVGVNVLDWFIIFFKKSTPNTKPLFPFIGAVGVILLVVFIQNSENETATRLSGVGQVLFDPIYTPDKKIKKLQEVDGSAFARIGPTYILLSAEPSDDINFAIGAGAGAASDYIRDIMMGIAIDEDAEKLDTGIIPAFVFDYGFIGFGLLIVFLINAFSGLPFPFWLLFILILPNANINTQLLWFGIACFTYVSLFKGAEGI